MISYLRSAIGYQQGMVARALGVVLAVASAGCYARMDALAPASQQASHIAHLFWWMLGVATGVYVVVIAAFFWAAFRRRRPGVPNAYDKIEVSEGTSRRLTLGVASATGLTVLILLVFLVYDFGIARTIANKPETMLTIEATGYQWWWKFRYKDPDQSKEVVSANELHIPVGVPVQVQLRAQDVIHSFWVPNLRGKKDLVPGYVTSTWFRADAPGIYRGQCAEFCGHQHAKMAFFVIAEPKEQYAQWLEAQRKPANEPTDSLARAGLKVFLSAPCSLCHSVAGTDARGTLGPDLTHLASRRSIAAGTLPMTRGHLAGWIVDPQAIKPGVKMPSNQLQPNDLQALLAYLETLK